MDSLSYPCTAFAGLRKIAAGALVDVALAVKRFEVGGGSEPVLVFDDGTGAVIDLDLRGDTAEIVTRLSERAANGRERSASALPGRGRGRPKLGVVAREVTLLPRHWDWLAKQPGGASQALRRLVDQARRADDGGTRIKAAREATYRFLSALAGDLPGFEDVARALFAGDEAAFLQRMEAWPADVRGHALAMMATAHDGQD